jgi:hypothetical protein
VSILEKAANVGIVLVSCAVVADIGYRHFNPGAAGSSTAAISTATKQPAGHQYLEYKTGDTFEQIPGLTPTPAGSRSLLFVVRSTCPYCTQSMDFYQRVVQQTRNEHLPVRLVGVCLEGIDACNAYFKAHNISMDLTVGVNPGSIKVAGTPTLLLLDERNQVTSVWTGALAPTREQALLSALAHKSGNS